LCIPVSLWRQTAKITFSPAVFPPLPEEEKEEEEEEIEKEIEIDRGGRREEEGKGERGKREREREIERVGKSLGVYYTITKKHFSFLRAILRYSSTYEIRIFIKTRSIFVLVHS